MYCYNCSPTQCILPQTLPATDPVSGAEEAKAKVYLASVRVIRMQALNWLQGDAQWYSTKFVVRHAPASFASLQAGGSRVYRASQYRHQRQKSHRHRNLSIACSCDAQ